MSMIMSMIILYNLFVFLPNNSFNWTRYLTYHTDWIHNVHVLYPRVPTLKEYFDNR